MFYRLSEIQTGYSIASDMTHIFDLTGKDPISRLVLQPKITNGVSYVALGHPDECISKIELTDGSDVLFSLDAQSAKALAYYTQRDVPTSALNYMALQWSFTPIEIYFGRFLHDAELALDPNKFNNLQLKVTTKIAGAMTGAAVGTLDIFADVFDEKSIDPKGFLLSRDVVQKTPVASAINYIELPTDLPLRILMTKQFSDTEAPEYNIASMRLSEANDKRIIFDATMERLQAVLQSKYPLWQEKMYGGLTTTARNYWGTPAFEQGVCAVEAADIDSTIFTQSTGGQKRIILGEIAGAFEALVYGKSPHGSLCYECGNLNDINDWWDLPAAKSGTLRVTFTAGVDTAAIFWAVTQQYRPY